MKFPCPKCGLPDINDFADDTRYCGKCEDKFRAEEKEYNDGLVAEQQAIIDKHKDREDCDCQNCTMAYIRILSLTGKEDEAYQLLNA